MWSCIREKPSEDVIFRCDEYTVYPDRVVEGDFEARATNSGTIVSDYEATIDSVDLERGFEYRFSINGRDNEMRAGEVHTLFAGGCDSTLISEFGKADISGEGESGNRRGGKVTLRVDMRSVLNALGNSGMYVTPTGDSIFKEYFKGVWVSGNRAPLRNDFAALHGDRRMQLRDRGDSVYEVTVDFNRTRRFKAKSLQADSLPNRLPAVSSRQMLFDAAVNISMAKADSLIRRLLMSRGAISTTDVAHSVILLLSMTHPEESKMLLRRCVSHGRIVQEAGGGVWPFSNDRLIWVLAAYEVYKSAGDEEWLKEACEIGMRTISDDMNVSYDFQRGLIHGMPSARGAWLRSQPEGTEARGMFEAISTRCNVTFISAVKALKEMRRALGKEGDAGLPDFGLTADKLNLNLWIPQRGYYSDFLYGSPFYQQAGSTDNLGQALSVVLGVATPEMGAALVRRTPCSVYGPSVNFPVLTADCSFSEGNVVEPAVAAYWTMASAQTGNLASVNAATGAMLRNFALTGGDGRVSASTGEPTARSYGTSERLVDFSAMGALAMRVVLGARTDSAGLRLSPCVSTTMPGEHHISGFRYREAILDVFIHGTGNNVISVTIDGVAAKDGMIAADLKGEHRVRIMLGGGGKNMGSVEFSKPVVFEAVPTVEWTDGRHATITNFRAGRGYQVIVNGVAEDEITRSDFTLPNYGCFTGVDFRTLTDKKYEGFGSRPHYVVPKGKSLVVAAGRIAEAGTDLPVGEGRKMAFVDLSPMRNLRLGFRVYSNAPDGSRWLVDVEYANGAGEENAQSRCVIRRLIVNGVAAGTIVMPCLGEGNWLTTGRSNMVAVELKRGVNELSIDFESPYCLNGARSPGTALLKNVRLIKLE